MRDAIMRLALSPQEVTLVCVRIDQSDCAREFNYVGNRPSPDRTLAHRHTGTFTSGGGYSIFISSQVVGFGAPTVRQTTNGDLQ
jgi:hypothetical protein